MFFNRKTPVVEEEPKEIWVIHEDIWDDIKFALKSIKNKIYQDYSFYLNFNTNPKPDTELTKYEEIKSLLRSICVVNGKRKIVDEEIKYTWYIDDNEFECSKNDKDMDFCELENGDLLIVKHTHYKKHKKAIDEEINFKIEAGNWKKKTITKEYMKYVLEKEDELKIDEAKVLLRKYETYYGLDRNNIEKLLNK